MPLHTRAIDFKTRLYKYHSKGEKNYWAKLSYGLEFYFLFFESAFVRLLRHGRDHTMQSYDQTHICGSSDKS